MGRILDPDGHVRTMMGYIVPDNLIGRKTFETEEEYQEYLAALKNRGAKSLESCMAQSISEIAPKFGLNPADVFLRYKKL